MSGAFASVLRFLAGVYAREPWLAEFWSAMVLIAWAVVAFSSHYELQDSGPMHVLATVAPNPCFWAAYCVFAGLAQLSALIVDQRMLRWITAGLASWFPSVVVISFVCNPPITPTIALYAGLAAMNLYSVARHMRRLA